MPPAPLQGLYGGWKSLKLLGDCKDTRRSGGNKGFESPRRNKASMEGGTFRNSLEIVRTHTDQSTIKDSDVARAIARLQWRMENPWNTLEINSASRATSNNGIECRPRRCKAFMEDANPWNSFEIARTPTDQSAIRDSNVAHTATRPLWRVEILGIPWKS